MCRLDRFMLYICDPFFIFSLIFSVIKTDTVIFGAFLEYFLLFLGDNYQYANNYHQPNSKISATGCCSAFA